MLKSLVFIKAKEKMFFFFLQKEIVYFFFFFLGGGLEGNNTKASKTWTRLYMTVILCRITLLIYGTAYVYSSPCHNRPLNLFLFLFSFYSSRLVGFGQTAQSPRVGRRRRDEPSRSQWVFYSIYLFVSHDGTI